jgi:hypothetical protein
VIHVEAETVVALWVVEPHEQDMTLPLDLDGCALEVSVFHAGTVLDNKSD